MPKKGFSKQKKVPSPIGIILKRERMIRNWSQNEAALALGIPTGMLSAIETGKQNPGEQMCERLCTGFGFSGEVVGLFAGIAKATLAMDNAEIALRNIAIAFNRMVMEQTANREDQSVKPEATGGANRP